ncbi:MAG: rhodanese-like domain-containing protein [Bacteroidales bacterium]
MKKHILTIIVTIIAGIFLLAMIGKKIFTSPYKVSAEQQVTHLDSDEVKFSLYDLAMSLKTNNPKILLIDIRSEKDYEQGHLTNAINVPASKLLHADFSDYINGSESLTKVLYGESETQAAGALSILLMEGHTNFKVLNSGYNIAKEKIEREQNPAYYFYNDEQKRYNYSKLMPMGASASQNTEEEVNVEADVPRGGC